MAWMICDAVKRVFFIPFKVKIFSTFKWPAFREVYRRGLPFPSVTLPETVKRAFSKVSAGAVLWLISANSAPANGGRSREMVSAKAFVIPRKA
jgi:hypothetical protein